MRSHEILSSCLCKRRLVRILFAALTLLTVLAYAVVHPWLGSAASCSRQIPNHQVVADAIEVAGFSNDSTMLILHQSWKTASLPPRFRRWSQSFARCHPEWRRRLWTDSDNENLIARHFPWFLPTYRKFTWPVQRADVSRLFYMYRYGGVYCDLDCECLQPFGHLLANVSLAFGAMEGLSFNPKDDRYVEEGQIENSFMYSIPEHPLIMRLIRQVEKKPRGEPEQTTGPYLLMREIHRLRRSKEGMPAEFRGKKYLEIFPPSFFNPFSWIDNKVPACKDKGGFTRADEDKCRAAHSNKSFVLQYHTQVWQAGEKHLNKD